ncbi:hypothetical protein ACOSQ3_011531 [Xanthoceras sorbifolium]
MSKIKLPSARYTYRNDECGGSVMKIYDTHPIVIQRSNDWVLVICISVLLATKTLYLSTEQVVHFSLCCIHLLKTLYMYKSDLDVKADDASSIQVCDVTHTFVDQSEKVDGVQGESVDSVVVTDSPQVEHKPKSSASDLHKELVSETGRQAYRSSPEAIQLFQNRKEHLHVKYQ